ncbi:hypothetical protein L6R52_19080 [Myxococcota bacterium]|nr:hypothetical protein [Myxococcota bacterium]
MGTGRLVVQRLFGGRIDSGSAPEAATPPATGSPVAIAKDRATRADDVDRLERTAGVNEVDLGAILARVGPVSETLTQRISEMPYKLPPIVTIAEPGRPLDLSTLDPTKRYVWTLDARGRFVVAPEEQPGFGVTDAHPEGRKVKHGDLAPAEGGSARGPARAGGELYLAEGTIDARKWVIDLSSSYCFNRADGRVLGDANGRAVVDYLAALGSDRSHLELGKNTFDPLRKLAGRAYLVLEKLGLGGHGL